MTVFLDTSTILAAGWSAKGLSRLVIAHASKAEWTLATADYWLSEVEKNVHEHPAGSTDWMRIVRD